MYNDNDPSDLLHSYDDLSKRELRSFVLHLLYALESLDYQDSLMSVIDNFNRGFEMNIPMNSTLVKTVESIAMQKETLDESYKEYLAHWKMERLSVMVRLILRYAIWEIQQKELDPKIIINEAIELAKQFAEKDAYRFVNGILDQFVKTKKALISQ
ncbi:transcription antitermination factor NusB [bacterium]|nr:MAG: transcription antitermination factor NusB [bacterium]QQR61426.1 MAG: transcription antitermination factor NusB [bacterium]QQR63052.1 MAG: transcription antitermination factor NusB [bacterium]